MDDDDLVRSVIAGALEYLGCAYVLTARHEEAIEVFRKRRETGTEFDLVLLDLTLPGGPGGLETLRALRTLDPNVRALVVSGYARDADRIPPNEPGVAGFLAKPFSLDDFALSLTRCLERESGN